jgi:DNA polymerase-3 subunit epsilon
MDFVAFDVETANSNRGSICSMGIAVVEDSQVVQVENWLCTPPVGLDQFLPMNVHVHGIRPEDVVGQPSWSERLSEFLAILDGRVLVAHNAAFDTSAIRSACDKESFEWPQLQYACTLVMARKLLSLLSYRLPFVCSELEIPFVNHHEASSDAAAAAMITLALAQRAGVDTVADLATSCGVTLGSVSADSWTGCTSKSDWKWASPDISFANPEADPDHALFGQTIVFTGSLEKMNRQEAYDTVAGLGATVKSGVSKKVTLLVIGDGFSGESPADFYTGKAAKAAELLSKGHAIEVLTEREFIEMVTDKQGKKGRRR